MMGDRMPMRTLVLVLAVICMAGAHHVHAQLTRATLFETIDETKLKSAVPQSPSGQPLGVALESTINPGTYYVGPSDVIGVNIWLSPPANLVLTVTPEGTLIIPGAGEVVVGDMSLAKAKEIIIAGIRKKYSSGAVTVTLLKPRPIIVEVLGYVLNPGLQTLTAADRANRAIELANTALTSQGARVPPPAPEGMSSRGIVVKHRDGSRERVDLTLYRVTKNEKMNPYLREGDVVVVPERDPRRNVFGVYGEVNLPARYEYAEGDSILDALHIAQGFTGLARTESVEFTRMDDDGGVLFERTLDLGAMEKRLLPNIALQPGDRIVVKANPDLRRDYRVSIGGEVQYPGTYPIARNRTKISDIVRTAGGFTESASLRMTELLRRSLEPSEIQMELLESLRGGVGAEDSAYYYLETSLRIQKEVVAVDFERLFLHADSSQDVILRDNDRINVASLKKSIYVFGQVVAPGHIAYIQGEGVQFYIRKAGGFTTRARQGDMKIVKARTRQWLSPEETTIEDGDYVWVPKEVDYSFAYYMNIFGQTAAIIGAAISIVLLVLQINN